MNQPNASNSTTPNPSKYTCTDPLIQPVSIEGLRLLHGGARRRETINMTITERRGMDRLVAYGDVRQTPPNYHILYPVPHTGNQGNKSQLQFLGKNYDRAIAQIMAEGDDGKSTFDSNVKQCSRGIGYCGRRTSYSQAYIGLFSMYGPVMRTRRPWEWRRIQPDNGHMNSCFATYVNTNNTMHMKDVVVVNPFKVGSDGWYAFIAWIRNMNTEQHTSLIPLSRSLKRVGLNV